MKRCWVLPLLDSLKLMTSDSVVMILFEFLLPRAHKMYYDGFVWRTNLYDKHMVSSSSLCKNKEVLAKNGGGNRSYSSVVSVVCHSRRRHLSAICVGLGYLQSVTLPPWFWEICLPLIQLPILSTWPLILFESNAAKFQSCVADMFKRKSFCSLYIPWFSVSVLIYTHIIFSVSCQWCGIHYDPPSTDRFLSISAHYLGSWSRDSFLVP